MTTITRLFITVLIVTVSTLNAQDFQGVATYRTQTKFDLKMDSTKMKDAMQTKIIEMMKKQFQKTYKLTFNKSTSLYQQEAELDKPQVGGSDFVISMGNSGSDVLYKNVKTQSYIDQKETMGKKFLIKDTISKIKWHLASESKYIGEYLCFKATYTKQVPKMKSLSFSTNPNTDNKKETEEDEKPELEDRVVTAWYTPQIPVNNGPAKYQGLPGLILEIHDGKLTIICSKIVINPEEKIEISQPEKGKEVNQTEYDDIMEKKAKEMMERFAPKKGGKRGDSFEIIIGG